MAKSSTPVAAGFSGVALAAMLAAPLSALHLHGSAEPSPAPPAPSVEQASAANTPNLDTNGPWYAICREYLRQENESESKQASHPPIPTPGFHVHVRPFQADEEMKEFAVPDSAGTKQLYAIKKHLSANLASCTQTNTDLKVQVLIATVADPHASHMQLLTDRAIDAISLAAAAENYSFSRYWLPWATSAPKGAPAELDEEARSRLEEPGVLIYRGPVSSRKLLLVFLVGETPTSGINRLQMARALRDTHEIAKASAGPHPDAVQPLLILGPEFSGTYESLADVLQGSDWIKNAYPAGTTIISSRTSVQSEIDEFRGRFVNSRVRLASLSLNETRFEEAVGRELKRRFDIGGKETAWLSEDETAAGIWKGVPKPLVDGEQPPPNDDLPTPSSAGNSGLRLKFPRDLSSLRNTGDTGTLLLSPAEITGGTPSHQGPSLTFAEKASNSFDSPPPFASEQEAIRAAAALKNMEERIHERRIQAIVIRATNPLDELYLLDYFRRNLPDVRLVTQDADEFLTMRPSHVSLLGTLVVTNLPMLAGEHDARNGAPIDLPSSHATGEYIGLRLLLQEPGKRDDALASLGTGLGSELNPNNARGQLSTCGGGPCSLPIEDLSTFVVGQFGLEPLEGSNLFTNYPVGEDVVSVRASVSPFGTGWLLILTALAVLTWWHQRALAGSANTNTPNWAYPPEPVLAPGTASEIAMLASLKARRRFYLYVACNQVALIQFGACSTTAVLLAFFLFPHFSIRTAVNATPAQQILASALFCVNAWLLTFSVIESISRGRALGWGGSEFSKPSERMTVRIAHIFPVATVITWVAVLTSSTSRSHLFKLEDAAAVALRCTSLVHGLSPLVPLMVVLTAYLLWALVNLRRLGAASSKRVWVEAIPTADRPLCPSLIDLNRLHEKLQTELQSCVPEPDWEQHAISLVWLFALCSIGAWNATRGLDGMLFQLWTLSFGLYCLIMICTGELQTAFRRWKKLKHLLDFLDRSPICSQFSGTSLRADLDSIAIWRVGSKDRNHLLQSHLVDLLDDALEREQGRAALKQLLKEDASSFWVRAQTAQTLSRLLNASIVDHAHVLSEPPPRGAGLLGSRAASAEGTSRYAAHSDPTDTGVVRVIWDKQGPPPQVQHAVLIPSPALALDAWQRHARYLSLRYVALMRYALLQIRNGLSHVLWAALAIILCVSCYPFQGEHAIGGLTSIACLGLIGSIAFLLLQFERHPLLSRLQGKDAGKTSFLHLAGQLFSIGGLPLIALLASQFPSLGDFLFSWVRPALEAAH